VRRAALRAVLACAVLLPAPLGAEDARREDARGIVIGTGGVTGIYYQAGNAICRLVERDRRPPEPPLPCGAMMTGGSVANVAGLRAGALDAALVQSDILEQAVRGTGAFQGRANGSLRALFSLHGEPYQLLVLRSLGLTGFGDLKGRKVDVGERGTAPNEAFTALMRRHDLTEGSFAQAHHLSVANQVSAFCDGDVEALGMLIGYPYAPYRHAIERCGGDLLALDAPADRRLIADTPAYVTVTVPRGTYPGIDRDVATFGVVAVAVATVATPEDVVYRTVRDVFERLDDLRAMHPALSGLDPRRMIADGITAPLHPGAVRYFREKGLL
jgi:uncharacterized protein